MGTSKACICEYEALLAITNICSTQTNMHTLESQFGDGFWGRHRVGREVRGDSSPQPKPADPAVWGHDQAHMTDCPTARHVFPRVHVSVMGLELQERRQWLPWRQSVCV